MRREDIRGDGVAPKSRSNDDDVEGERRRLLSTIEGIPAAGHDTSQPRILPYLEQMVSST